MLKTGGVREVCHYDTGMFGELNNKSNNQNSNIPFYKSIVIFMQV